MHFGSLIRSNSMLADLQDLMAGPQFLVIASSRNFEQLLEGETLVFPLVESRLFFMDLLGKKKKS